MNTFEAILKAIDHLARRVRKLETYESIAGISSSLADHNHTISGEGGILAGDKHSSYSEFAEIATPTNPAAGSNRIYFKSDSKAYRLDDAGNEVELGAGGSAGHTIQDEGVSLTARTNLDFKGAAVTATDDAVNDKTIVTIATNVDAYVTGGRAWYWYGIISVADGRGIYRAQSIGTVKSFYVHFDTAPTGANAIVTLKKNGGVIATLTITAGDDYAITSVFSDDAIAVDDEYSYAITQIGSTVAGYDMLVEMVTQQVISIAPNSIAYVRGSRSWFWYGNLSVANGRGVYVAQSDGIIEKLYVNLVTAPTGADITIDLKINSIVVSTVTVAAASDYGVTTTFTDTAIVVGDEISYEITQVGSTVVGANAVIEVVIRQVATTIAGTPLTGGYIDFVELLPVPGSPAADTARLYSKDVAGVTKLCYKDSLGTETILDIGSSIAAHVLEADPHTQYQKESEKGTASGYASLDAGTKIPTVELGGAGADNTKFLRGDQTWQVPAGGAGGHTIQDEGVPLTARTNLDFVGTGVAATDDAVNDKTIVTITAGAGTVPSVVSAASLTYAYNEFR